MAAVGHRQRAADLGCGSPHRRASSARRRRCPADRCRAAGRPGRAELDAAAVDDARIGDLDGAADARGDVEVARRVAAGKLDVGHDLPAARHRQRPAAAGGNVARGDLAGAEHHPDEIDELGMVAASCTPGEPTRPARWARRSRVASTPPPMAGERPRLCSCVARRRAPAAERAGHPLACAGARTSRTSSRRRERAAGRVGAADPAERRRHRSIATAERLFTAARPRFRAGTRRIYRAPRPLRSPPRLRLRCGRRRSIGCPIARAFLDSYASPQRIPKRIENIRSSPRKFRSD